MRGYGKQSQGPSWLVAVVGFVVLVALVTLFRGRNTDANLLSQQFAAKPPQPGAGTFELPPLPSSVSALARTAAARIGAGSSAPPLTPVAQGADMRVEIAGIRQTSAGLRLTGAVTNLSQRQLSISLAAFRFTDGTGTVYTAENAAATTLDPGLRAPLDLTLPIKNPRELTLDVALPGSQALRMILIQNLQ